MSDSLHSAERRHSPSWRIDVGDCRDLLAAMPDESVATCVTSPPYFGLRDYGHDGQIGLELSPEEFVVALVDVFRGLRRVLRDDGTLWLNLGDSYAQVNRGENAVPRAEYEPYMQGSHFHSDLPTDKRRIQAQAAAGIKQKDLLGIPWMVAFALRADGWYLRSDIIWHKPNPMPESVTDRPTKAHEYLFLLSKSRRYFYDAAAIKEAASDVGRENGRDGRDEDERARPPGSRPRTLARLDYTELGRNKRSVWTVTTKPYAGAHFATFPPDLIEPCILAGSRPGDVVLDPFSGAGTTGVVALRRGRSYVGLELNPEYADLARFRIRDDAPLLNGAAEVAA